MFEQHQCAHCANFFYRVKAWSKYCSRECQRAALNEAAREARRLYREKLASLGEEAA
jgi:hypothetical protein